MLAFSEAAANTSLEAATKIHKASLAMGGSGQLCSL